MPGRPRTTGLTKKQQQIYLKPELLEKLAPIAFDLQRQGAGGLTNTDGSPVISNVIAKLIEMYEVE